MLTPGDIDRLRELHDAGLTVEELCLAYVLEEHQVRAAIVETPPEPAPAEPPDETEPTLMPGGGGDPDVIEEPGEPVWIPRQWWVERGPETYRHLMCLRSGACLDVALAEGWPSYGCGACRMCPGAVRAKIQTPPRIVRPTGRPRLLKVREQVERVEAQQIEMFPVYAVVIETSAGSRCPECNRSKEKKAKLCSACRRRARRNAGTVIVTCPNPDCGRRHRVKRSYAARQGADAGYCDRDCYRAHVTAA